MKRFLMIILTLLLSNDIILTQSGPVIDCLTGNIYKRLIFLEENRDLLEQGRDPHEITGHFYVIYTRTKELFIYHSLTNKIYNKRISNIGYTASRNERLKVGSKLKSKGTYFAIIDEEFPRLKNKEYSVANPYIECYEGIGMFYINKDYNLIENLPYRILTFLYSESKKDGRNYIKEFLNKTVKSVCTDRVDVYSEKGKSPTGYLIKNDLVEILEEDGDWVRVKYLKTDKEYWTHGSCLE